MYAWHTQFASWDCNQGAGIAPGTEHAADDCMQHSVHYWHPMIVEADSLSSWFDPAAKKKGALIKYRGKKIEGEKEIHFNLKPTPKSIIKGE